VLYLFFIDLNRLYKRDLSSNVTLSELKEDFGEKINDYNLLGNLAQRMGCRLMLLDKQTYIVGLRRRFGEDKPNYLKNLACAICFEDLDRETMVIEKCQHCFHEACLKRWYRANGSCPSCREAREVENKYTAGHWVKSVDDLCGEPGEVQKAGFKVKACLEKMGNLLKKVRTSLFK